MRIKDFFTVPEGQKVTERHLRRVLSSSLLSILLCMCCLISSTWAWFTVSIENYGNEIQIASLEPEIEIKASDNTVINPGEDGSYQFTSNGKYSLNISLKGDFTNSSFGEIKNPVYLIITTQCGETENTEGYIVFSDKRNIVFTRDIVVNVIPASISFSLQWTAPDEVIELIEGEIGIGEYTNSTTEDADKEKVEQEQQEHETPSVEKTEDDETIQTDEPGEAQDSKDSVTTTEGDTTAQEDTSVESDPAAD